MDKNIKDLDIKTKTIPLIGETLKEMPLKQKMRIRSNRAKASVVRATISKLKEQGYDFEASEAGLIDEIYVTRIK
ncbi:hypothetical protein LJB95_01045 [Paludibacteraceae bacterium OttesenSCG-928-F17]|nr:hypothetical protein [Paludibacteraceae bacterium OttesenSCG-928-F17]